MHAGNLSTMVWIRTGRLIPASRAPFCLWSKHYWPLMDSIYAHVHMKVILQYCNDKSTGPHTQLVFLSAHVRLHACLNDNGSSMALCWLPGCAVRYLTVSHRHVSQLQMHIYTVTFIYIYVSMTAASRRLSILEQCQAQHYLQFACGSVYVWVMPIMLTVCVLIHYAVNGLSHAEYMCHESILWRPACITSHLQHSYGIHMLRLT